ncbi:MAG: GntR family transcriptional regulator [Acidimicrobiaceae bacterium]|jgi:DNA-binding FadR family transcriptional regulator|nr:GntR family transcriptional regulator [Acidimicrobiaceae bacterium]
MMSTSPSESDTAMLRQPLGPDGRTVRRPRRLATPVVEEFVDQIVGGEIPPGSPLPREAALCEHFGVSRTVIREVLKVLEQKGLLQVHNGKGAWTTERDSWNLLDPLVLSARVRHDENLGFLSHLVTVRMALEAEMAAQAAVVATDEQIAELGELLSELAYAMGDVQRYVALDIRFHDALMRASGNELGRTIVLAIIEKAHAYPRYGAAELDHVRRSQPGHTAVYEALIARDPERAMRAVRDHIGGAAMLRSP